uniref:Phage protein n=1 Tax=Panagrellus redivivus TaxID=6233 RepID=A0A7E4VND4_PANRE
MRVIGRFYCNNTVYRKEPKDRIQFWNKIHPFPYARIGHGYLDDNGGLDITIHDYFTVPSLQIQFFMNYTCGCQNEFESNLMKIKAEFWDLDEAQQHPYNIGSICLDVYCKNREYWKWTKDMCIV